VIAPARALLLACVLALPVAGAAVACTGGDDVSYAGTGSPPDGGRSDGSDEAGRIVRESGADVITRPEGGHVDPSNGLPCDVGVGVDSGGCESSAGLGCCAGAARVCVEQAEYYSHAPGKCDAPGSIFLTCLQGDDDNTCCWGIDATSQTKFTRFTASCTSGPASCDPKADGGACPNGDTCHPVTCNGTALGYCGSGASPCQ
jgi:hypothetical protein